MNKKIWLKKEHATWRNLWQSLLEHGLIEQEMLRKSWRDVSTEPNRWFCLAHLWLTGDVRVSRKEIVEHFVRVFGDVAECNSKLLEWGRAAEDLKAFQVSLN